MTSWVHIGTALPSDGVAARHVLWRPPGLVGSQSTKYLGLEPLPTIAQCRQRESGGRVQMSQDAVERPDTRLSEFRVHSSPKAGFNQPPNADSLLLAGTLASLRLLAWWWAMIASHSAASHVRSRVSKPSIRNLHVPPKTSVGNRNRRRTPREIRFRTTACCAHGCELIIEAHRTDAWAALVVAYEVETEEDRVTETQPGYQPGNPGAAD